MSNNREELRLGFLASHNGSSMQAIVDAIEQRQFIAEPVVVVSNNSQAPALEFARQKNIPYKHLSKKTEGSKDLLDHAILAELQKYAVNLVVMSGWMILLESQVLQAYKGRILNAHPALFSSPYKGKLYFGDAVHAAVLENKETKTGVTIHIADEEFDHGKVLAEKEVLVQENDTIETLRTRVQLEERKLYIELLKQISLGNIVL